MLSATSHAPHQLPKKAPLFPLLRRPFLSSPVLWLRKDWMDKCGLEEPKTMEDIYNILEQFLVQDPGGNGEGKTVGLVIDPEIAGDSGGSYMANNIFTLYGAFPW